MQRIRLAMGGGGAYTTHLETLRAILGVDAPAGMRKPPSSAVAVAARTSQGDAVSAAAQEPDTAKREKARGHAGSGRRAPARAKRRLFMAAGVSRRASRRG